MKLDPRTFVVHDIGEFPFVVFNQAAAWPGYAGRWEKEMTALVDNGLPFVVVYDRVRSDESHEDRRHRGIWLKHNKQALGRLCKALISIEPDAERRAAIEAAGAIAVKAFGIAHEVVATRPAARDLAQRLVGGLD